MNGHYGAFVVRKANDSYDALYDYDLKEHTIVISDWMHYTAEMFAAGLPNKEPGPLPVNVLINGKGTFVDEVCITKLKWKIIQKQKLLLLVFY